MVYTTKFNSDEKKVSIIITGDTPKEQEYAVMVAQEYLNSFLPPEKKMRRGI
jgi:hypothetical protein